MLADLRPQLFVHATRAARARLAPVRDWPGAPVPKPQGGLWTSTYDPAVGSAHLVEVLTRHQRGVAWLAGYPGAVPFTPPDARWVYSVVTPAPAARIAAVNSPADCAALWARYGRQAPGVGPYLSFAALAADYDALHLTAAGAAALTGRLAPQEWTPRAAPPHLHGWHYESTVWFRWVFTRVRPVPAPPAPPPGPAFTDAEIGRLRRLYTWVQVQAGAARSYYLQATPAELGRLFGWAAVLQGPDPAAAARVVPAVEQLQRILLAREHAARDSITMGTGWPPALSPTHERISHP